MASVIVTTFLLQIPKDDCETAKTDRDFTTSKKKFCSFFRGYLYIKSPPGYAQIFIFALWSDLNS